ncbi:carbohydrate-binding protein [Paenibacillus sp. IB182496]|uniref:Carbohydrate-binding protein n=1 Tax=Paenibacillus sabuli TaxID=2772509 RepID=A0A927GPZ6_9BACL|nr:TIM-barrel domain-containing protein [Paenibacillus sabuli]MBD2843751.1 carbohydrate-binding protein [Paenibacillus sabuli]
MTTNLSPGCNRKRQRNHLSRLLRKRQQQPRKLLQLLLAALLLGAPGLALPPAPAQAYVSALGDVIGTAVSGDTLTLTVDNGAEPGDDLLELSALESGLLKVNYRPNGVASSASTPMLDPAASFAGAGATIDTSGDPILVETAAMTVEIARTPARMTIKRADGTTLLWEPAAGGVFHDGVRFQHASGHHMYGIRGYNAFEDEGDLLRSSSTHPAHAGEQGDTGGPFIWSTAGYGVLVDSDGGYPYTDDASGKLEFYYGGTPTENRRYTKTNVEYYVMLGDPYAIMDTYADVTGASPLLPDWSLGFSNFEWGIDQDELEQIVDTYRAKNIPLDGFALDYDWKRYGEDNYGEFAWNTANFPDAASTDLKDDMTARGVKLIGITKPRVVTRDFSGDRTDQYADAEAGGYWYPGHAEYTDYFIPVTVRSVDPYSQAARDWLWDHSEDAFDKGIAGWWNDETDKVSSGAAQYWFGNFMTTHWSQAMYEGQRDYTDDAQRVWQTARTYYPGAQRYATTLWSGDIGVQFKKGDHVGWAAGMREQRAVMLSAVNLGQPKWGMDTGGFNQSINPHPELYARWMQFGALTPVFRAHGNFNQQRQPWYYGMTAESAAKAAIQLRYSLLPYLYAYERSAYDSGVGLVRPLLFDYPNDAQAANYTDAWMFGDWLLAAPVVDEGQTSKAIYLPAGEWTDYFRGHTYTGGQTIHYPVNAESWTDMPLFVKAGAIIPSRDVQDYVGQTAAEAVEVDVWPSASETAFTYYEDDGASYDYEDGETFAQRLTTQQSGGTIAFTAEAAAGTYTPEAEHYLVKLHGQAGTTATLNGSALTAAADLEALRAMAGEGWAIGRDLYGPVTYVKLAAGAATAKTLSVSGSVSPAASAERLEAERASLSGDSIAGMAVAADDHGGYSGTGFAAGLDNAGAAVTFYADVRSGGDYEVALRYANATGGAKAISLFVNGSYVKQVTLPALANWDTWATQTATLPLEAGRNSITYRYFTDAGDTGNVNLDYIEVPFVPSQSAYEAESAALTGGAGTNTDHWHYTGTGFVDGLSATDAEALFRVDVPAAGSYDVAVRYANGSGSAKTISAHVNGVDQGQLTLPSPSMNWNVWQDSVQTYTLAAGTNTIALRVDSGDSGGVNLDRLLVGGTVSAPAASETNLLDDPGFERTLPDRNWTQWHPSGQVSAYGIDAGNSLNPPESAVTGSRRAYFHAPGAYQQSIHQQVSVPVNHADYRVEAWVRLGGTSPSTARLEIGNHGGAAIYRNLTNDGQWHYVRQDNVTVTSGVIDVGFYVDSPGGTVLQIDDVRVTRQ